MAASNASVVARVQVQVFRAPIATPVVNAFGTMRDRPMALVAIEARDGATGFGEIWCNFPVVGAEHRARLLTSVIAPLLAGRTIVDPAAEQARLASAIASQVLQTGEPGPFNACLAAIDQALCDLAARRAGVPLWKFLGATRNRVPVYTSGIGPEGAEPLADQAWRNGFRAFKLKVGFGRERDLANLSALRASLPHGATLMADANQAWSPDEAHAMASAFRDLALEWLEEPIAADQPATVWQALARAADPLPLAAGENLGSAPLLDAAVASAALRVLQPDIGKWGGPLQILPIARRAVAAGMRFCPHWLGGGIGLVASMHLLAAAGGDGRVEWDANPNPLREAFPLPDVVDGFVALGDAPGLGFVPDLHALQRYRVPL
ncbi:MAG TPA: mandelate racemase/muconate lactonizing enzyme family protein [Casimicrobiaceae bacterium]|nr:mandelate racemase/muconate lactonizing enzyme family protein [Casimicrobiaceae bacterium]